MSHTFPFYHPLHTGTYLADGYPLCADLPKRAFLAQVAIPADRT